MFVRKTLACNVLLAVIISNSVLVTAFATNSKIGLARRTLAFQIERAASVPGTFEPENSREREFKQLRNPIDRKTVVKSLAVATVGSVLLKNRFIFKHALDMYRSSLVNHPLQTKVLTGATLSLLGDGAAQIREGKGYDVRRATSFAAFDACYRMVQHRAIPAIVKLGQGNVLSWILSLAKIRVGISFLAAMERTLVYQFVLIPFFYYPVFFLFTGIIQGLSMSETVDRAKRTFLPCFIKNISFWIPTQLVMFGLVDEKWQVPYACLMGIIWNSILSIVAGKAKVDTANKMQRVGNVNGTTASKEQSKERPRPLLK